MEPRPIYFPCEEIKIVDDASAQSDDDCLVRIMRPLAESELVMDGVFIGSCWFVHA